VVTVTSGFEESASDSKGGGSSKEAGGSLTAGWSGLYFAAQATASTNFVTTSNWTNSRTKSLSTSESTETKFFFPSHAQTQYAKWFVELPDKNKKLRKFFLPGPTIVSTRSGSCLNFAAAQLLQTAIEPFLGVYFRVGGGLASVYFMVPSVVRSFLCCCWVETTFG